MNNYYVCINHIIIVYVCKIYRYDNYHIAASNHIQCHVKLHNVYLTNKRNITIQIIGSLVEFSGNVLFSDNADSSTDSVALHLLSFAQVQFNPGLKMTFSDNDGM